LKENREILDKIAKFLYEKETITGKEFMKIFRTEKGLPDPDEEKKADKNSADDSDGTVEKSTESEMFVEE
ncbi:MAG: AAA family ATPase, partial [Lachnospiraceae bacterium]|nr:AAA family ATPase [Lachnospiraceae bacterium]